MPRMRDYPLSLDAPTVLDLPLGSIFRCVTTDNVGNASIWFEITPTRRKRNRELRTFVVVETEQEIPSGAEWRDKVERQGGGVGFVYEIVLTGES